LLRDASVICLSSVDWAFNRQNPQEVAHGFAAAGNRVLYVENTGVRTPRWRDLSRLGARMRNRLRARAGVEHVEHGVDVFAPLVLPVPHSRAATALNCALLLRVIRRWLLRRGGSGPVIVIAFLPTPLMRSVIAALRPELVVYYRIDRIAETSPAARWIGDHDRRMAAEADVVLVTAPGLRDDVAPFARRVEMLESGVRCDAFAEARRRRDDAHHAFDDGGGIVAGFVGSLRESTDVALLEAAADLAPDITFVLAGPQFTSVRDLAAKPNVRIFGAMPHANVPAFFVRFDVGLLPYVIDGYTAGVMPAKLKEYLAAGVAIVSTPLPAVRAFAETHPGLITFAADAESFVAAIRSAAAADASAEIPRRLAVARAFDWTAQIAKMSAVLEDALAQRAFAAS
jgi:glycosyltransferase involved in cell wall biosynthesis